MDPRPTQAVTDEHAWVLVGDTVCHATTQRGVITSLDADSAGAPDPVLWTPGFVDIHCHGALGHGFDSAEPTDIEQAIHYHRQHGTTVVVLSLVSAPIARLVDRLDRLRQVIPDIPGVIGVHLEGPFLAPDRRGAHDLHALTLPSPAAVEALIEAGHGLVRQVTIAPELPGALDAVDRFTAAGVTVAVGHTQADQATAAAVFDRGARILTHALNAMPGLGHRQPGPVGAALDRDHVVLEVVADGIHVHPTVIRTLFAAAPGRVALVSDAMAATGLGDGHYRLGDLDVDVRDDRPVLRGTETLAGSTLTLARAIDVAVAAGVPPLTAVTAATVVPARAIGHRLAVPQVGMPLAELVPVQI